MQLNKEDGGNRQFICVQMPELCDENSEAYKAGYKTIAEISKERIRRAGKKVISDEWKVISKVEQQKYGCTKLSRADCLAKSNGNDQTDLFSSQEIAQGGAICPVGSDETCSGVNSIEHSGGTSKKFDQGIYSVSGNSQRLESGSGDTATIVRESGIPCRYGYFGDNADAAGNRENVECPYAETINCPLISDKLLVDSDNHSPLTTNHYSLTTNHSPLDLGFKVLKLQDSNFKQWRQVKDNNIEEIEKQMEMFIDPVAENATVENMVYELLLKSGKDLNSRIEKIVISDKLLVDSSNHSPLTTNHSYYRINENELILMLESASEQVVASVLANHPQKVIALDRLFEGNDQLKTNTALQMRDSGVEFKTI